MCVNFLLDFAYFKQPIYNMHKICLPTTRGGSFYIHEWYVDIWLLVADLTTWQVWVSRCKKSFIGKRTPPIETLMMIWFNLYLYVTRRV